MLIETPLKPRTDGTVIARSDDKAIYIFKPDADGALVCDVTDEGHIAWLIGTGNFYPASGDDFTEASEIIAAADDVPGDEGEALDDDEGDENAPLIEEPAPLLTKAEKKALAKAEAEKAK